ncbi:hypothetical protein M409DRAFT_59304 [Zasmidium cellare ATCC 36951]|uniref:Uncharacterized protein n=1 Tax=Zasmidium cellare ATCC 36951 TaxID=1080233 RepID=A0A6A6C6D0_ZASCE|nr:uncharacterized protein M409DRAFT_59304 [Zasmidium cellare ATCC 36951]KAF2161309.1 hypothetical protein M409DRAFT_59304 [Zasmidium cellare ATCC 36951]
MAATSSNHAELLDQLHLQLNSVLEQTGRVFVALANNPKARPAAQVTKLQQVIPEAATSFHEALDQFESELRSAQTVMRRDLAVCRERSGVHIEPPVLPAAQPPQPKDEKAASDSKPEPESVPEPDVKPVETVSQHEPPKPEAPPDEDIVMEDPAPDDEEKPVPVMSFDELIAEDLPKQPSPPLAESKPSVAAHTLQTTDDLKPLNEGLHLDTKPSAEEDNTGEDQGTDDDKAPDTANDLDSLFNDPMSAGGAGGENQDFNFDQDNSNDIDFGSFGANFDANGADNDNISSLLPGLEDYANTQPTSNGADLDLNELFGVGSASNGMDSQGAGEQRDSTFEDLMDFNLDGMDTGSGGNNNTNNADFDFDSLFN